MKECLHPLSALIVESLSSVYYKPIEDRSLVSVYCIKCKQSFTMGWRKP